MSEEFTEVTSKSYFSRIGNSIKAIAIGLILFAIAFPLLWFNEGRAVNTLKRINYASDNVQSVDSAEINRAYEGRLIHITGTALTSEILKDEEFSIAENAIKLLRTVEMYQWVEESNSKSEKKLGGSEETTTSYRYKAQWSEGLINSENFKDSQRINPTQMPFESKVVVAENVTLGAFSLPAGMIANISGESILSNFSSKDNMQKVGEYLYKSMDPNNPKVGDVRIKFTLVKPQSVSVMGKQNGNTLGKFVTPFGDFSKMMMGIHSADEMISAAKKSNTVLTWVLRLLGFVLMFFGMKLVFNPLAVLADVVPFIGSLVGIGTGLLAFFIAFSCAFMTISVAWISYRPIVGIPLLLVSLFGIYNLIKKAKQKKVA